MPDQQSNVIQDFLYAEMSGVSEPADAKPFDGLVVGSFTASGGQRVTFKKQDLAAYLANTVEAIESSVTETGELVGLPIDKTNHDHQGGAGWIVGAELAASGDRIKLLPKWTDAGADLISKRERRFFSPTVDTRELTILGGSLCNWPAQRDGKGRMALHPIELSEAALTLGSEFEPPDQQSSLEELMTGISETVSNFIKSLKPGATYKMKVEPETSELSFTLEEGKIKKEEVMPKSESPKDALLALVGDNPELAAKLVELQNQAIAAGVSDLVAKERQKAHVAEFAARVVGGTAETPVGLPITKEELVAVFDLVQGDDGQKKLEEMIEKVWKGKAVAFQELGHSQKAKGAQQFPAALAPVLTDWIASGRQISEFFAINKTELGDMEAYDLSAFEPKKKEGE